MDKAVDTVAIDDPQCGLQDHRPADLAVAWAVAAVDRSVPAARAPGAVRCFVIAA